MNESFETILNDTYCKLELIERELKKSNNLQIHRSPSILK